MFNQKKFRGYLVHWYAARVHFYAVQPVLALTFNIYVRARVVTSTIFSFSFNANQPWSVARECTPGGVLPLNGHRRRCRLCAVMKLVSLAKSKSLICFRQCHFPGHTLFNYTYFQLNAVTNYSPGWLTCVCIVPLPSLPFDRPNN